MSRCTISLVNCYSTIRHGSTVRASFYSIYHLQLNPKKSKATNNKVKSQHFCDDFMLFLSFFVSLYFYCACIALQKQLKIWFFFHLSAQFRMNMFVHTFTHTKFHLNNAKAVIYSNFPCFMMINICLNLTLSME